MARCLTLLIAALLLAGHSATAQTTTLERIAERGSFIVGFVPDGPPMSFIRDGQAVGYSIDLCRQIAIAVRRKLGREELTISYVPFSTPAQRIDAIETGKVDIDCGVSTVTLSRREKVDFTLMTFITGGSILSLSETPIRTISEVNGKRVALIPGTTTEESIKEFLGANNFEAEIVPITSHSHGMDLLTKGEVDAYSSDRAMLIGQAILKEEPDDYVIARDVFSFEPYGFMVQRGDTEFRLLADRALAEVYRSARIRRLYLDWFGSIAGPMPPIVKAMYEFQAVGD
ncbi:MAG: amino acid ABC transporter substrate-binding protein [Pseudomonadota bacterium]